MDDNYYPQVKKSEIEYLYYRYNAYVMEYDERAAQIIKDIYTRVQKIWTRLINIRIGTLLKRNKKSLTCTHKNFDKIIKKFVCEYIRVKCHCTIKLNRAIKKLLD